MTTDKDAINKIKSGFNEKYRETVKTETIVNTLKSLCREMHRVNQGQEMICLDCLCYRNDGRHEYCLLWRNSNMFLNSRDVE